MSYGFDDGPVADRDGELGWRMQSAAGLHWMLGALVVSL